MTFRFADIVLPLAVGGRFTYAIPEELSGNVVPGVRVLVQFGKKNLYTGIVFNKHNDQPSLHNIRAILRVLDPSPLISETQLRFWQWMSDYYMCTPGEVLKAALPSALSPEGKIDEKVSERYRPKQETMIRLSSGYTDEAMNSILDKLSRAPARNKLLSAYLHMTGYSEGSEPEPVSRSMLLKESGSSPAVLDALVKSGILSSFSRGEKWYPVIFLTRGRQDGKIRYTCRTFEETERKPVRRLQFNKQPAERQKHCAVAWRDIQRQDGDLYSSY